MLEARRSATYVLQCGHSPKAVENRCWSSSSSQYCAAASMRPQPEGRGEPGMASRVAAAAGRASMRPQPEGRGERYRPACPVETANALQCGHSPKAVENNYIAS